MEAHNSHGLQANNDVSFDNLIDRPLSDSTGQHHSVFQCFPSLAPKVSGLTHVDICGLFADGHLNGDRVQVIGQHGR